MVSNPHRHRVRGACHYPLRGSDRREHRRNPAPTSHASVAPSPSSCDPRHPIPRTALTRENASRVRHPACRWTSRDSCPIIQRPSRSRYTDRRTSVTSLDIKATAVVTATISFAAAGHAEQQAVVTKSASGICHCPGGQFFERTSTTSPPSRPWTSAWPAPRANPRAARANARALRRAALHASHAYQWGPLQDPTRWNPIGRTTGDDIAEPTNANQRSLSADCSDRGPAAVNLTGHHPTTRAWVVTTPSPSRENQP